MPKAKTTPKPRPTSESPVLDLRALNRATLARQMLLRREKSTVPRAVERLLAIQAQWPKPPFIALHARLEGFAREHLASAAMKSVVVRGTAFRTTIFVMTARDYGAFRGTITPTLERGVKSITGKVVAPEDHPRIVTKGRAFFAKKPATFDALRDALDGPTEVVRRMAYLIRMRLPLLQVPTDVPWGWHAACDFALAESMIDAPIDASPRPEELVLRYLAALGPATVADAQSFTGVTGLKPTFQQLRPRLVSFRSEEGKELFDLPDAPRPDPSTEAPVRFLPDFDNAVMGHLDRRRIIADEDKPFVFREGLVVARTYLVDGRVAGTWRVDATKRRATLVIEPIVAPKTKAKAAIEEEAEGLIRFLEPDARTHDLAFDEARRV